MNLNYNINNTLLSKNRNFFLGQVDYEWFRAVSVATGIQSGSIIFGTGSIEYVPFAPTTFFVSGTYAEGRIGSGSALGQPVKVGITGSGVWPLTGSNQFSIVIGGNLGFNQSQILTLSAGAGNMNLSGSKISSSFIPVANQEYIINFGLTHTKGNIYNPLINWNAVKTSPFGNNVNVNGELSASFNLVQNTSSGSTDKFTNLAFIKEVSGSAQSSSFNNEFGFSVTASYTASINNVTGSTTMSFVCAEEALNQTLTFFNPTTTLAIGTASFVASNNTVHSLVTSINYNKGNLSTASINYKVSSSSTTQDLEGNTAQLNGNSSSLNLKKDIAVLVNYNNITASISGTYSNDFSFNQTASLTSSILPNTTGSVTMSLEIPEIGFSTSSKFFNPISTGIKILSASFVATTDSSSYNITASVINNKGNESNSNINFKVSSSSTTQDLEGNTAELNGNSSSLNLKKDIAIIQSYSNITASINGTYKNNYSFNQTASLTSSILPNTTGSVTMSLVIPEIGFSTSSLFFNPISAGIKILSASFVATTASSSYNITASVINNKGNESNANINWLATGSKLNDSSSIVSSFGIRKDGNVQILNVNDVLIPTSSTFKNDYAFNITSSLTSSYNSWYNVDSSSFYFAKNVLRIPEVGIDIFSYGTSSLLTGSFAAQTSIANYNITGSTVQEESELIEYVLIGGGGGGGEIQGDTTAPGSGGGAGALLTGSIKILQSVPYTVLIGSGGLANNNGQSSSFSGTLVPYDGTWTQNFTSSGIFLNAPGGGKGVVKNTTPGTGGSGGGGFGGGADQLSQPPSVVTGSGALAVSASVLNNSMTATFIDITLAGSSGSDGTKLTRQGFPGFFYGVGGNGGGKPTYINWLNPIINSGSVAGGGGAGNQWFQGVYQSSASFGGGDGQSESQQPGNAKQYSGGGGGGGSTYGGSPQPTSIAGYGASGSMSIRYTGSQKATGGIITTDGGYTIHTFTSSGIFQWTN